MRASVNENGAALVLGVGEQRVNDLSFDGKTVLVIGGSSGIGNACAQTFSGLGANVHVTGTRPRSTDYAEVEDSDLSGLTYSQLNLSDRSALDRWEGAPDRVDTLILSQGIAIYKRREFEIESFAHVLEVNLMSVMACAMRFHAALKASGGSLIVISSSAAFHATKGNPAYNASKTGALGLTRTLAQAWAADGIRVNGIAPGFIATKLTEVTTRHPERLHETEARIPLGRIGMPEECAKVALFLASPMASYMIGQTLLVDGGLLL